MVDNAKNFIEVQWEKPKQEGGPGGVPYTGYNIERKDPRTGNDERIKVLTDYAFHRQRHHHHCRNHLLTASAIINMSSMLAG